MSLDRLDEYTLQMSRDQLLVELNDQIEITAEMMRLHREEYGELKKELTDSLRQQGMWRHTCYVLVVILIIVAISIS